MAQKLLQHNGRTFVIRQSASGGFNVFLKLRGRGSGQITWVGASAKSTPQAIKAAIQHGKMTGQF